MNHTELCNLIENELVRLQKSTNKDCTYKVYGWELEFVDSKIIPNELPYYRFVLFMSEDKTKQRHIQVSEEKLCKLKERVYL